MKLFKVISAVALLALSSNAFAATVAADKVATLRQAPLTAEPSAPVMSKVRNTDERLMRNYPTQPPMIPHSIDKYRINLNVNACMSCHARKRTGVSKAPMISVTHYMDRENNFLSSLAPRRYFCNQCHVPQHDLTPLVENQYTDLDSLMDAESSAKSGK